MIPCTLEMLTLKIIKHFSIQQLYVSCTNQKDEANRKLDAPNRWYFRYLAMEDTVACCTGCWSTPPGRGCPWPPSTASRSTASYSRRRGSSTKRTPGCTWTRTSPLSWTTCPPASPSARTSSTPGSWPAAPSHPSKTRWRWLALPGFPVLSRRVYCEIPLLRSAVFLCSLLYRILYVCLFL